MAGFLLLVCLIRCHLVLAEDAFTSYNTPRFTLFINGNHQPRGAQVQLSTVAQDSIDMLNSCYEEYSHVFRSEPVKKVVLRFLSPEEFRRQTGAPPWTSAMYFHNEISIPFTSTTGLRMDELRRALRHEYVHAVLAEFSDYRAPAWLDEGVAQLLEGPPNPLLGPALREWVKTNPALPLEWLKNGFTTLDPVIVPTAYAQSLFAVRKIVRASGFPAITAYLMRLRENVPEEQAFEDAFDSNAELFEQQLTSEMRRWAKSDQVDP